MSKSLNEVWHQMQIQRQMEQQRQMQIQRQIEEERERSRREYVLQNRMLEKTNTTVAAAAAAAAGAGGGSGNRVIETVITSTTGNAVLYYTNVGGVFSYFIYDFELSDQSEIRTITTGSFEDIRPVTEGGFYLRFLDSDNSKNIFYFINLSGQELWTGQNNDGQIYDPEAFSRYISLYYETDTNWILVVLQKDGTVREYTFDNQIEGGGYSYDNVFNGGFVVKEIIEDTHKYYLIKDDSDTPILIQEIDTLSITMNLYQYAFSSKILTIKNYSLFEVFNGVDGSLIATFDASDFSNDFGINDFSFISDNGSFLANCYDNENNNRVIVFFSGASNSFDSKTVSNTYSYNFDIGNAKNYQNPSDYINGSSLVYFYDSTGSFGSNGFEYKVENLILPIFGTDESLRDFYTFSNNKGIFTNADSDNLCILRGEDYILTLLDTNPYGCYFFSDHGDNSIIDGGDDMYDTGNQLYTENGQVSYTHTQQSDDYDQGMLEGEFISDGVILTGTDSAVFGASSSPSYFTNHYPGLFVLCARNTEIDEFRIDGSCGADGSGTNAKGDFQFVTDTETYQVFFKKTYNTGEPSINQIIILNAATSSGITQVIGGSTESDLHKLDGLASSSVNKIYYLLMSEFLGPEMRDDTIDKIVEQFLLLADAADTLDNLLTSLNNNYTNLTDLLTTRNPNVSILRFNRIGSETTIIDSVISNGRRIEDDDRFGSKNVIQVDSKVTNRFNYGWGDLTDFDVRRYSSFYEANNNQIGNYVVGQELVMKDTVNDKYWAIKFTEWTQNANGGGFAYTRQLIEAGTFSGEIIYFTHSNYTDTRDVIEAGVLEITRGNNGPIYNAAVEASSNGRNPAGTLWNSFYTKYYETTKHDLIDSDGTILNTANTEGNYSNNWNGPSYVLEDSTYDLTYICNINESFTQLERRYDNTTEVDSFSDETGLRPGVILMYTDSDLYYRILTATTISEEFFLTDSGNVWKVDNRYISTVGALIVTIDDSETHYLFYDLSGNLIFDKQISGSTNYNVTNEAKRLSIVYYESDEIRKIIFFNGDSVTEYNSESTNSITAERNDYNWWD